MRESMLLPIFRGSLVQQTASLRMEFFEGLLQEFVQPQQQFVNDGIGNRGLQQRHFVLLRHNGEVLRRQLPKRVLRWYSLQWESALYVGFGSR